MIHGANALSILILVASTLALHLPVQESPTLPGMPSLSGMPTQINAMSSDPAAGLPTLAEAEQWDQLARRIVALRDLVTDQLVPQPANLADPQRNSRTLLGYSAAMNRACNRLLARHPELLERWRPLVQVRVASQIAAGFQDRETLRQFVERFGLATQGPEMMVQLSQRYAEAREWEQATWYLSQLDPRFERFRNEFGQAEPSLVLPEGTLSESQIAEAAIRLIVIRDLLRRVDEHPPDSSANSREEDLAWFRDTLGRPQSALGNRVGPGDELLAAWFRETEVDSPATKRDELRSTVAPQNSFSTARSWRLARSASPDPSGNPQPRFASVTEYRIPPLVIGDQVLWRDANRIYAAELATGRPTQGDSGKTNSSQDGTETGCGWEDHEIFCNLQESDWPGQVGSRAHHQLSHSGNRVFAIMDRGESNCVVGIDLHRQARLLPGFPILPPDSSWQFEGPPCLQEGKLLVAARRYLPGNRQVENHVLCFGLRTNEYPAPLTLQWTRLICQAPLQTDPQPTSFAARPRPRSATRLTLNSGRVLACFDQGVVAALRIASGDVEWLVQYPRSDYSVDNPWLSELPTRRLAVPPLVHRESVFVLPAENPDLLSINKYSGFINWQTPLPASFQLLGMRQPGTSGNRHPWLMLGGDQMVGLNRDTGQVTLRVPEYIPNTMPGMRSTPFPDLVQTQRLAQDVDLGRSRLSGRFHGPYPLPGLDDDMDDARQSVGLRHG